MLGTHSRAILEYSGGKDSTALLYMARPYLDKIDVYYSDTGDNFPHMNDFVISTCKKLGARLTIIKPPIPINDCIEEYGIPSDIVPFENMKYFQSSLHVKKQKLQSTIDCCFKNKYLPLHTAVIESGIKLILRGSKGTDKRISVGNGFIEENGIEIRSPLWNWTDDDVYEYLKCEGIELPSHYSRVRDSLDCWSCTGYLGPQWNGAARLEYVKNDYPELWKLLSKKLLLMRDTLMNEVGSIQPSLNVLNEVNDA